MPRVSEEHLTARRQQILAAARTCFARNGFHATSMHDVIAEAGLSTGAVYRYFRSKEDLVTAIAEQVIRPIADTVGAIVSADPPPTPEEVLRRTLTMIEPEMRRGGMFPLAIQVWAESLRNPQLAEFVERIFSTMHGHFVELARRNHAEDPVGVGSALVALVPGYGLQRVLLGGPDLPTYLAGVRTLLG
ncbi:MAG TPA: TetR/AcrR family transcriptional regulator [Micromonosporaceae bacterium]|nr:TetR/AcrR family transcriptional regulator [Micromonosporaceae bacterium]